MANTKRTKPASQSASVEAVSRRKYFDIDKLTKTQRRSLLDEFARALMGWLSYDPSLDGTDESAYREPGGVGHRDKAAWKTKDQIIEYLNSKELGFGAQIDIRQFDNLQKCLYSDDYIRINNARFSEMEPKVRAKLSELRNVVVVPGANSDIFSAAAAEDFVLSLKRIGVYKCKTYPENSDERVVNVGIVSGRTTGAVIRAAADDDLDWSRDLDVNVDDLPRVRVIALNVCLTVPQHLKDNATILAYQLTQKINNQSKTGLKAEPFGLSAPLMIKKDELQRVDQSPQTFEVVRITEPYRVRDKIKQLEEKNKTRDSEYLNRISDPTYTELDIILSGVGQKPPPRTEGQKARSIFHELASNFDIDVDALFERERVVGDLAFTAINAEGKHVPLKDANGDEYLFYSAVQLDVWRDMAGKQDKEIILVARRDTNASKVPAIYASTRHPNRYVSKLVIDEETARVLKDY